MKNLCTVEGNLLDVCHPGPEELAPVPSLPLHWTPKKYHSVRQGKCPLYSLLNSVEHMAHGEAFLHTSRHEVCEHSLISASTKHALGYRPLLVGKGGVINVDGLSLSGSECTRISPV